MHSGATFVHTATMGKQRLFKENGLRCGRKREVKVEPPANFRLQNSESSFYKVKAHTMHITRDTVLLLLVKENENRIHRVYVNCCIKCCLDFWFPFENFFLHGMLRCEPHTAQIQAQTAATRNACIKRKFYRAVLETLNLHCFAFSVNALSPSHTLFLNTSEARAQTHAMNYILLVCVLRSVCAKVNILNKLVGFFVSSLVCFSEIASTPPNKLQIRKSLRENLLRRKQKFNIFEEIPPLEVWAYVQNQ